MTVSFPTQAVSFLSDGRNLAKNIMIKDALFVNEFLWSAGMITITHPVNQRPRCVGH